MHLRADLHIHTLLSPCGDLEMSPVNIVRQAREKGLDLIGITDHNSTRQAPLVQEYGKNAGITVLLGVEINTREEVHCLAFFPTREKLDEFQEYLDRYLPDIPNDPDKFGYQVVIDTDEMIVYEEPRLLISAIDQEIGSVEKEVHRLGGIFIPAHINKSYASIVAQLGFIPPDLHCDALEVSPHITPEQYLRENPWLQAYPFIQSSDAHYIGDIGKASTGLTVDDTSFDAVRRALADRIITIHAQT